MDDIPLSDPHRRTVVAWTRLLPLAAMAPSLVDLHDESGAHRWCFFSAHEAAVVDAATRRLVPGPKDGAPACGSAGAAECGVVRYIDGVLGLLGAEGCGTRMVAILPSDRRKERAWQRRIERLRVAYQAGVVLLDAQAGGDFSSLCPHAQDRVLGCDEVMAFTAILFQHTLEGMRRSRASAWVA